MSYRTIITACALGVGLGLAGCEDPAEEATEEVAEERAEERAEALGVTEATEETMEERAEERAEARHEALEMRYRADVVPVRSVLIQDYEGAADRLLLYRDDVDCASVTELKGDDRLVAHAEIEPGFDGVPAVGAVPVTNWEYEIEGLRDADLDDDAEVSVTRVGPATTVEGTVTLATNIEDDAVELNGPFTATVCEVTAAG